MVSPKDIVFITTSTGSVWESYCRALVRTRFPESRHLIIDGRRTWSALGFLNTALRQTEPFVVLVDEDCFILDREQLLTLVSRLASDDKAIALGTPDGGTFHRHYNPIACNTFFLIFKREQIRAFTAAKSDWKDLRYCDFDRVADGRHLELLDSERMGFELHEPYYPLFWLILFSGGRILYEIPYVRKDLLCSAIRLSESSGDLLLHMWWLRRWNSNIKDEYFGIDHATRYARLRRQLDTECLFSPGARFYLVIFDICRRVRVMTSWVQEKLAQIIGRVKSRSL